ncbi:alpha-1B-glycoprotein-like [Oenanthe melanoleuca]|uniref:alpha-1B-glycoprotein-like n=1 Tax=Oenanthe melanoleuca TaxID=2939378 RepID=UPI0024C1763F|nr:alpha-1B-glycoprotein-like [Oenanthe melanoleuca]
MGLLTFILLFASLPILFPLAVPSDLLPPAPDISVTPAKPRFLIGDTVSILCAVPGPANQDWIQGFRFSRMSGSVTDVRTSKRSFVRTFNVTDLQDGGFHTCSYIVLRHGGGHVISLPSQAVLINVQDRPIQPNLTVTPSSVTVEGQPLVFLCAVRPGTAERRFGFFQDELEVTDGIQEGSGAAGVWLQVEKTSRNRTGNFSCRYEEMTEGRWITSYPSDSVQVIVEDLCLAPILSVEPPSGVVAVGHRLRLSCATPRRRFRQRFEFYRNGTKVTPNAGDVIGDVITWNGSELIFLNISQNFAGNFSCQVEEEVGGAWLEAPPSRAVTVVVRAPPTQPILLLTPLSASPDSSESQISLTCLAPDPSGHVRRRFHFYCDGYETTEASPWPQISVAVPSAATAGAGHFSCRYEEELDMGWVLSPLSAAVRVPASAQFNLLPLLVGGVMGVDSLLLVLLLAAWIYRRRRGSSLWQGLSPGDDTRTLPMGDLEVAA